MFEFRKAERRKAKLRLALCGVAGSGKTFSSLLIAKGLGGRTCIIDTESRSADLYAKEFVYDVAEFKPPFTPARYVEAIKAAEKGGYDNIIIDSITHGWAGIGGALDMVSDIQRGNKGGNSYTAWRYVTPEHNKLVEAMLGSSSHIIATMRSKPEYVLNQNEKGKQAPTKVGLSPIQRDGMDHEFTVVLDVSIEHYVNASKDRTRPPLFDGKTFVITEQTGKDLLNWLNEGKDESKPIIVPVEKKEIVKQEPVDEETEDLMLTIFEHYRDLISMESDYESAREVAREAWKELGNRFKEKGAVYQNKIKLLIEKMGTEWGFTK